MGTYKFHNLHEHLLARNIKPFVDCLLKEGREPLGLLMGLPVIKDFGTSSCQQMEKRGVCDRFKLELPYATMTLTWDILFDRNQPDEAPDVIFRSECENFIVDMTKLTSLENWTSENPRNLIHLIIQLLIQYKEYQLSLVSQSPRIQVEYNCLIEQAGYNHDHIEVHFGKKVGIRNGPVNILIKLPVKLNNIPTQLLEINPDEDNALLLVNFSTPDSGKVTPHLYLSPRLESVLGGVQTVKLPTYRSDAGLIEYVPLVCSLLEKKIEQVCDGFSRKREYVVAFQSHFGRSMLEFDQIKFSHLSLLQEWNDFFFIIHINLPPAFPVEKPGLTFQSIYHDEGSKNKPYKNLVAEYPYSPRWTGMEMAERAKAFFLDYIPKFQKMSLTGAIS